MQFFLIALYFLANTILVSYSAPFTWSVCGDKSYFTVKNVTINPSPAQPGRPLETSIEGEVLQELTTGGRIVVSFPLYSLNINYCNPGDGRPCPVKKGQTKVPLTLTLPSAASLFGGRNINGQVRLVDSNGTERLCLKISVPIRGRIRENSNWIEEIDALEYLLSSTPNLRLQSPMELFKLVDWAVDNKNTEDFQSTFMERTVNILEPVLLPEVPAFWTDFFGFNF